MPVLPTFCVITEKTRLQVDGRCEQKFDQFDTGTSKDREQLAVTSSVTRVRLLQIPEYNDQFCFQHPSQLCNKIYHIKF